MPSAIYGISTAQIEDHALIHNVGAPGAGGIAPPTGVLVPLAPVQTFTGPHLDPQAMRLYEAILGVCKNDFTTIAGLDQHTARLMRRGVNTTAQLGAMDRAAYRQDWVRSALCSQLATATGFSAAAFFGLVGVTIVRSLPETMDPSTRDAIGCVIAGGMMVMGGAWAAMGTAGGINFATSNRLGPQNHSTEAGVFKGVATKHWVKSQTPYYTYTAAHYTAEVLQTHAFQSDPALYAGLRIASNQVAALATNVLQNLTCFTPPPQWVARDDNAINRIDEVRQRPVLGELKEAAQWVSQALSGAMSGNFPFWNKDGTFSKNAASIAVAVSITTALYATSAMVTAYNLTHELGQSQDLSQLSHEIRQFGGNVAALIPCWNMRQWVHHKMFVEPNLPAKTDLTSALRNSYTDMAAAAAAILDVPGGATTSAAQDVANAVQPMALLPNPMAAGAITNDVAIHRDFHKASDAYHAAHRASLHKDWGSCAHSLNAMHTELSRMARTLTAMGSQVSQALTTAVDRLGALLTTHAGNTRALGEAAFQAFGGPGVPANAITPSATNVADDLLNLARIAYDAHPNLSPATLALVTTVQSVAAIHAALTAAVAAWTAAQNAQAAGQQNTCDRQLATTWSHLQTIHIEATKLATDVAAPPALQPALTNFATAIDLSGGIDKRARGMDVDDLIQASTRLATGGPDMHMLAALIEARLAIRDPKDRHVLSSQDLLKILEPLLVPADPRRFEAAAHVAAKILYLALDEKHMLDLCKQTAGLRGTTMTHLANRPLKEAVIKLLSERISTQRAPGMPRLGSEDSRVNMVHSWLIDLASLHGTLHKDLATVMIDMLNDNTTSQQAQDALFARFRQHSGVMRPEARNAIEAAYGAGYDQRHPAG